MTRFALRRGAAATLTAAGLAGLMAITPAVADAAVSRPDGGTHADNFCGTLWKDVYVPGVAGQQAKILNDDFGTQTCLYNSNNVGFVVTKSTARGNWTEYPNIATGWEQSELPLHHSAWKFPVKVSQDGNPWADVTIGPVQPSSSYNAAYDIWFDKTGQDPVPTQANGTELMIWLQHENVLSPPAGSPVFTIDGIQWAVMKWVTTHNGVSWNYIAFVAVSPHTSASLSLNPFFSQAERLSWLSSSWYLTSVDFGFEITRGGVGLHVSNFKFGGVN